MKQMRFHEVSVFRFLLVFFFIILCNTMIVCPDAAFADNEDNLNDILDGFEEDTAMPDEGLDVLNGFDDEFDDSFEMPPAPGPSPAPTPLETYSGLSYLNLDGYFKIGSSYNFAHKSPAYNQTDWRGLSRLRTELQLELNIDLPKQWQALVSGKSFYDFAYRINGQNDYNDNYTDEVIDDYESEIELREAYLLGSITKNMDIKIGRQIVVWGKSDNIRVTDVINPLDLREPAMTDIEDLRLPLTMTRLDYYVDDFNISALAIHEIRFNKNPAFGSDFYPAPIPPPPEDKPGSTLGHTEYALAINGIFSGWDFSAYYADYYNDETRIETVSGSTIPGIQLTHDRLQMVGTTANIALGNWLLKGETAWFHGFEFINTPDKNYDRVDVLAGFEYSGFSETTISIEAVNRHICEFKSILKQAPDQAQENLFQSAFRFIRTFENDTITMTVLVSLFGLMGDDGAFERYTTEYDVNDFLSVLFGIVTYQSGNLPEMQDIGQNDRVLIEAKYSF
jgi:hypothetical protein